MTMTSPRRRRTAAFASLVSAALVVTACGDDGSSADTSAAAPVVSPAVADSGTGATSTEVTTGTASDSAAETRPFEADNGTIEIPTDPQRIAAIGSAGVYLSLGVEPVGLGPKADPDRELAWLPPEAAQANDAAVDLGDPIDYEKIAEVEPDLIVVYDPAHVWEGDSYDEERLQSIAPTVYIELNIIRWEEQTERLADAVGALDAFEVGKAEYEALAAEIHEEHADLLESTTFTFLNSWGTDGEFAFDYPNSYCTAHATDAGVTVLPVAPTVEEDGPGLSRSIEGLGDFVADVDVLVYPLLADGSVKPAFAPILESNIWTVLPQVVEGRAVGVRCPNIMTYPVRVEGLKSLQEALATLSEAS